MAATSTGPGVLSGGATALPVHPLTGLTAVGIVGGKPVWPIRGGSGDGGSGNPSGQAPPVPQPPATPPAPQPTGQAPAPQPQGDKTDLSALPADVRKIIEDARAEAARYRTDKQTAAQQAQAAQEQRDAVLKALGLTPDGKDEPPDPNALAAQVEQYKAAAWENAVSAGIVRVAGAAGADADLLLDSSSFLDSLESFIEEDPNSADFRTKLQAHITAFVGNNPRFKTAPAGPVRSGGDHPGGGTPPAGQRNANLHEALKHRISGS